MYWINFNERQSFVDFITIPFFVLLFDASYIQVSH